MADAAGDGPGSERRLDLARRHLGWGGARVSAYLEGLAAESPDRARMRRHDGEAHGFVEADLGPEQVDALGYSDGVRHRTISSLPRLPAPGGSDALVEEGEAWVEQGSVDVEPADLEWRHEESGPAAAFLGVMTHEEWIAWFEEEHRVATEDGREGYGDLLMTDIRQPVVHYVDPDGNVDIWDGWHRIAACVTKGAASIPRIYGTGPAPAPRP